MSSILQPKTSHSLSRLSAVQLWPFLLAILATSFGKFPLPSRPRPGLRDPAMPGCAGDSLVELGLTSPEQPCPPS